MDPVKASLRLGMEVADTDAEGPGRRYAVWVQGCPLRCPGCCNPHMLSTSGGYDSTVGDVVERILDAATTHGLEGVTLLGGEPFTQAAALASVAAAVRAHGLTVMIFSGYRLAELQAAGPHATRLLAGCDLLVDGTYERTLPDRQRRWVGSTNQQVHHLTDAYRDDDPRFAAADELELRWSPNDGGQLQVNGVPWQGRLP